MRIVTGGTPAPWAAAVTYYLYRGLETPYEHLDRNMTAATSLRLECDLFATPSNLISDRPSGDSFAVKCGHEIHSIVSVSQQSESRIFSHLKLS